MPPIRVLQVMPAMDAGGMETFVMNVYHIALDDYEHGVVIRSLNDKKTDLKKEGKSTDAVDDLIIKIGHAPRRKFKVVEKESCRESR